MYRLSKLPARWRVPACWLMMLFAGEAFAEDNLQTLKAELDQLRSDYESRIAELEARIEAAEFTPAQTPTTYAGTSAVSDKAFNPAVSLILNGQFTAFKHDTEVRDVPGFQLGGEAAEFSQGMTLGESELNLQANIDDKFFGASTISFAVEDGESVVEIEEAYLQTIALPAGLQVKAGRFLSNVGYLNSFHRHATAFYDDPLPYRLFFGGRLADTGLAISWTAPTLIYWQLGAEVFRGDGFPASGASHDGAGMATVFTRLGGDFNESHSWLASLGYVSTDVVERGSGGTPEETGIDPLFTGDSDTWVGSFVWKWAPYGNTREKNFRFTAEYLRRNESGEVTVDPLASIYDSKQNAYYVEGVYKFLPQWSVGLRYDRASANNTVDAAVAPLLAQDFDPWRVSAMLDFWNSEFSTLRLQFVNDHSSPVTDNQLVLQYIMNMGAHGAHNF